MCDVVGAASNDLLCARYMTRCECDSNHYGFDCSMVKPGKNKMNGCPGNAQDGSALIWDGSLSSALCECVTTAMIGTFRNTLSAPKNFTCFHLAASKQVPDLDVVAILVSLEIHSIEKSA